MKLKFPKKIEIGDHTFNITYNKKISGGSFDFEDLSIEIGTKYLGISHDTIFGIICHEVMEIIHVVTSTRYVDFGTMRDFKFFMTHKEFEVNTILFSKAIQKFIT